MFKKMIFNAITLTTLLCSCLQLQAALADDIRNLKDVQKGEISILSFKDAMQIGVRVRTLEGLLVKGEEEIEPVRYTLLGETTTFNSTTLGRTKVYLTQLPCISQSGALCGSCAYENGKVLARKNLNLATAATTLNSQAQDSRIDDRASKFAREQRRRNSRNSGGNWVDQTYLRDALKEKGTEKSTTRNRIRGQMPYYYKIPNHYPIILTKTQGPENAKLNRKLHSEVIKEFKARGTPVVFMINELTGAKGHWIAVRVEKMQNGDIAILFTDSLVPNRFTSSQYEYFRTTFKNIIENLGYNFR